MKTYSTVTDEDSKSLRLYCGLVRLFRHYLSIFLINSEETPVLRTIARLLKCRA